MSVDYAKIHRDIQEFVERQSARALVLTNPDLVFYATGIDFHAPRLVPSRLVFFVAIPGRPPIMLVARPEERHAQADGTIEDVRTYKGLTDRPIQSLVDLLRDEGVESGRLLIDLTHLPASEGAVLSEGVPQVEVLDCTADFGRVRMIKQDAEVEQIESVNRLTLQAIEGAFQAVSVGSLQTDLAGEISQRLTQAGALAILGLVVGPGSSASAILDPHAESVPIGPGEHIRGHAVARWNGYYSDVARTAFTHPPPTRIAEALRNLLEIERACISMMKAEVPASSVFAKAREELGARGYDLGLGMHHIGHGIGTSVHEYPYLADGVQQPLLPGMVFAVEPMITIPDGIVHVEDIVVVTDGEPRVVTESLEASDFAAIS